MFRKKILPDWLQAIVSGILLAAAVPPLNLYFLAWFGLVPLIFAIRNTSGSGFREGYLMGFFFLAGTIYWIGLNSGTLAVISMSSAVVAVSALAVGWGAGAWVFKKIFAGVGRSAWLLLPVSWVTWEGWLSNLGEIAFPLPTLALTQAGFEPALQVMEYTGLWGTTFWVAGLNVLLYYTITSSVKYKRIILAGIIFWVLLPVIFMQTSYRYYDQDYTTIDIAIIQGSVDPAEKWRGGTEDSFIKYDSLSTIASFYSKPDFYLWPETALPTVLLNQSAMMNRLYGLTERLKKPVVTGASGRRRQGDEVRPMNVAYLVKPEVGIMDEYAKYWLVPFGERVPFQKLIPALGNLNLGQAEFLPGNRQSLFRVELDSAAALFPPLICYECVFPDLSRKAVKNGANLLTNISNDAWYGKSSEPFQMNALCRFRAIETRRSLARVTNTGVSVLIDPLGRVITQTGLFVEDWKTGTLPLMEGKTVYVRFGNWFLLVNALIYGVVLILIALRHRFKTVN